MLKGQDGIYGLLPFEKMTNGAKKLRDNYAIKPGAPIYMKEFGFYSIPRWVSEGKIKSESELADICGYDDPGYFGLGNLGWTEAAFFPAFEEEIIEDRGKHEVVRDSAGRNVLFFKGRRSGFMPEYIDHPVKDMRTWEELVKWRLDPKTPGRAESLKPSVESAFKAAQKGIMIQQCIIGGYMYLRSLIGPLELMYKFHDEPELIENCMQTWFELADAITTEHQKNVTFDEVNFGEDICYNGGLLISPKLINIFLLPYYQQLIENIKKRQIDKSRHLYIQIDTDGKCEPAIPLYKKMAMDVMSPFEVASGCDVVEIGQKYPELVILGGTDKRVLSEGSEVIDLMLDRIMPAMKKRGGYIPTCDHGVPEEVSFENYVHFRKRLLEYSR